MDLSPFLQINPCGYENLAVTQIKDLKPELNFDNIKKELILHLGKLLGYTDFKFN